MDSVTARLTTCFSKVFPALTEEQIRGASVDGVPAWDSLATLNLVAVIEEEFGIIIDLDEMEGAPSFEKLRDRIGEPASQA